MARKASLERLLGQLAAEIRDGVARSLESYLGKEIERLTRRVERLSGRGGGRAAADGRGRGGGGRVAVRPADMERKRQRILKIVQGQSDGITSKDVALRMKVDARGVGKLLARMHKQRQVKKDGDLYFPA
jgi:hypothetical protein